MEIGEMAEKLGNLDARCGNLEKGHDVLFAKTDLLLKEIHNVSTRVAIIVAFGTIGYPVMLHLVGKIL